jgi:predicted nucleic acid-binding protein
LEPQGFTPDADWARLEERVEVYQLVLPEPSVLDVARELHRRSGYAFWDAMLVAAGREAGVSRLYSEDLPAQAPPAGIEIINPFA